MFIDQKALIDGLKARTRDPKKTCMNCVNCLGICFELLELRNIPQNLRRNRGVYPWASQ